MAGHGVKNGIFPQRKSTGHDDLCRCDDLDMGVLAEFEESFPPLVARSAVHIVTGGLLRPQTVRNDESLGRGPRVAVLIGKKRAYPRRAFLAYLNSKGVLMVPVKGS